MIMFGKNIEMIYTKHIFICTNQRPEGAAKPSCGEAHGLALVSEFKKLIKEKGLNVEIRAQKTGCLDLCEFGPALVVYPEGVFYQHVQLSDVAEIVEEHLVGDKVVERLLLVARSS
jgi:(2Fe-2S) ferredoxin